MVKAPLNVDLARLRQFLKSLETDAQITLGDVDLNAQEIEILKREIADIEGVLNGSPDHGTRAVLFQIDIDYGVDYHQNSGQDHARDEAVAQAA
jgi:ribosomal protein L29